MADGFDTRELDKYTARLLDIAQRDMPKETKKFVRQEGAKLKKRTLIKAKATVKKQTGTYFKSIKAGKVYIYQKNGGTSVRVYSSAPHAHLIELGFTTENLNHTEEFQVPGKHVFEKSGKEFEGEFNQDAAKFVQEVLGGISK